jgi:hypothetical protein
MTPEEFKERMEKCRSEDIEAGHGYADDLMCELLRSLGYGEGIEVFENMEKWYA